ncbi:MAG: DNA recombination protein RmuC [Proteobacteria bacterium]|nr:DNA recombination protein RmuC [Pseudomonadota bacterium]
MPNAPALLIGLIVLVAIVVVLQLVLLARARDGGLSQKLDALRGDSERVERALREEQRAGRGELSQSFEQFRMHVQTQMDALNTRQRERLGDFGTRMDALSQRNAQGMQQIAETLQQRLDQLTANNEQRLGEVRTTLETRLKTLQDENATKLEQMRNVVDEKLQSTLQARFNQSFGLISERLEAVQRGLGEMQGLATGVDDLKRVLGNVKTRGILGETQLGALLEQMLAVDQYASNVAVAPGSPDRVEYAIRLPGQRDEGEVLLPIDAKFPVEDYQRLLDAQERADVEAANAAALALERRVRDEAKTIRSKYVAPPHTTDFAILFVPTEGLYAEVLRRPGLFDDLQRRQRVIVAGPTTLCAILSSLQLGFRTLAIEKRSGEIRQLLGAVKTEFAKFADVLDKAKRQIDSARNNLDELVGRRTRAIERQLRGVESLPAPESLRLLGDDAPSPANGVEDESPGDG